MPTGRLKAGHVKVAGVATDEVKLELLDFMLEEGLPSLSRAVGVALSQWLADRRKRRSEPTRDTGATGGADRVLHPGCSVQNPAPPPEG